MREIPGDATRGKPIPPSIGTSSRKYIGEVVETLWAWGKHMTNAF